MSDYIYTPTIQHGGENDAPYRLVTTEGVRVEKFQGKDMLVVEPEVLERLAYEAFYDVSFYLRPAHMKQVASILDDPDASENDLFVARCFLENSVIAAIGDVTAVKNPAADRAAAYGLESILIDGNDVDVVYETACTALDRARKGEGPSLIEAQTYRHGGHSRADPGKYRPDEEVARWKDERDPIGNYRVRLIELGIAEAGLVTIESETEALVDKATEEASNSPPPPLEIATTRSTALPYNHRRHELVPSG